VVGVIRNQGNPLAWPVVEHHRYLIQAVSFDTAHVIYDWPYGPHMRCIRRVWAEQALTGTSKYDWRLVAQTTMREFNHTYTTRLEQTDETDPQQLRHYQDGLIREYEERLRLAHGKPFWNSPSVGIYNTFGCWEEVTCKPVPDAEPEQIMYATQPFALDINARPAQLLVFLDRIARYRELLSAQQIISLRRVEQNGRRYNPHSWPDPVKWGIWGLPDG
jgi:hypothetical protein